MILPPYFSLPPSVDPKEIRKQSEELYRTKQYYCSEAVIKVIRDTFCPDVPDCVIAMNSAFPIGMGGSGCACGAVTGGMTALGLIFGRTAPGDLQINLCMKLARELHDKFHKENTCLCCRVLTKDMQHGSPEHMEQCIRFTGEITQATAEIILRETKAP